MTSEKKLWVALVAVALLAIGAYYFPIQRDKIVAGAIGSATNYYSLVLDSTLTVGGAITQTGGSAAVAVFPGTLAAQDIVFSAQGYSTTTTASATFTAAQFCQGSNIDIPVTVTAGITITLPAATSTYLACGSPALGAGSTQYIVNESSNTVTIATTTGVVQAGTGMRFLIASTTPGTGTSGQGTLQFPIIIPASTTLKEDGIYTSTSTLWLHNLYYKML